MWRKHDGHSAPFHSGLLIDLAHILQFRDEPREKLSALFLVHNRSSPELHACLDLMPAFQKLTRMLGLEFEIVLVRMRPEAYFLEDNGVLFLPRLLLLLLLLVTVFAIVDDLADRRIGIWCNFYKIQAPFPGQFQGIINSIDAMCTFGIDDTDFLCTNPVVYSCGYFFPCDGFAVYLNIWLSCAASTYNVSFTHKVV